jgi:SAM-dependent methyltransferase
MGSIFVASSYKDLSEYRKRVEDVIKSYGEIFTGMEFFGASAEKTIDVCRSHIDKSDIVICIVGASYGTRPDPGGPSYTEIEITHARHRNKKIVPFFLDTNQPVLLNPSLIAQGPDHQSLTEFKSALSKHGHPQHFTSPDGLATQISNYLGNQYKSENELLKQKQQTFKNYRESNYDSFAEWYDRWYQGHWKSDHVFKELVRRGREYFPDVFLGDGDEDKVRVLDCACGTGNPYVAFTRAGYNVIGTDGSKKMLCMARKNCHDNSIPYDRIIEQPINWQDLQSYKNALTEATGGPPEFDVIVISGNSFCHIPPTKAQMSVALSNFRELLRPNGLLMIDTKRFVRDTPLLDENKQPIKRPTYRELRFMDGEWRLRTERVDDSFIPEKGGFLRFHTCMHYDVDTTFGVEVDRALIVLTISGGDVSPTTLVMPYYPLPAAQLESFMTSANFIARTFPAPEDPNNKYRYDLVVGRKSPNARVISDG